MLTEYRLIPRILDNRPLRRPGGAKGAPKPQLGSPGRIVAWLVSSGDIVHLEFQSDDMRFNDVTNSESQFPAIPWELIEWWIPL